MCRNTIFSLGASLLGMALLGFFFFVGVSSETEVAVVTLVPTPEPTVDPFPGINFDYTEEANADVEFVRAVEHADGTWTFYVTVRHPDTGWDDYADGWDVVLSDGMGVVKPDASQPFTRVLFHPHENEQPFTRSQSGIVLPEWVSIVTVRAHDSVHGFGGREVTVVLTTDEGVDYIVERAD